MNFTELKSVYEKIKEYCIDKILELAKEEIESQEKKALLDEFFTTQLEALKGNGFLFDIVINILISCTSKITQAIYDNVAEEMEI